MPPPQAANTPTPTAVTVAAGTLTAIPRTVIQLTFLSKRSSGFQGLYAIDFESQGDDLPILSEPKLLFEERGIPEGFGPIFSYAWSPDGQHLVPRSYMNTIRYGHRMAIVSFSWQPANTVTGLSAQDLMGPTR
jgi:hypothetical protein